MLKFQNSAMEAPTSTPDVDFCTVKRVIKAHPRHFRAISVLFLLPLSFSIILFPTLLDHLSQPTTHATSHDIKITTKTKFLSSFFALFVVVFSLLATSSITYTVFHGFYGQPVKLLSDIKSAFASFFPLLLTVVFAQSVIFGFILTSGLFLFSVIKGVELVGFEVELSSPYFIGLCLVFLIVLACVLVYLQVNWSLACMIVVVESTWGIEALKRSNLLIKGMRKLAFSVLLLFDLVIGIMISASSFLSFQDGAGDGWKSFAFVYEFVWDSVGLTLWFLHFVVSINVLYIRCKVVHGELKSHTSEEFAEMYVSLHLEDGNAPHVASGA